jgi:hypothetical protein
MTTLTPSSEIRVATRQAGGFYALKSTEEDIVASRDHFTTHIVLEEKSELAGRRDISTSRRRQPGFTIRGEAEPPSRSTNGSNLHSNFTSEPGTVAWTTTAPKFSAPCSPTSYSFATTAENTNTTAQFAGSSTASEFPDPLELAQPCCASLPGSFGRIEDTADRKPFSRGTQKRRFLEVSVLLDWRARGPREPYHEQRVKAFRAQRRQTARNNHRP